MSCWMRVASSRSRVGTLSPMMAEKAMPLAAAMATNVSVTVRVMERMSSGCMYVRARVCVAPAMSMHACGCLSVHVYVASHDYVPGDSR